MKVNVKTRIVMASALLLLGGQAQAAGNWDLMIEPYVLATSIEGDASVGRIGGVEVDVDFDTILDNLDFGLMLHGEAIHASGWGVMLDYGLMDLKGDKGNGRGGVADARIKQAVTELALMYRMPLGDGETWDIFVGARHWENELRLKLVPAGPALDQVTLRNEPNWTDAFLGGRYTMPFSDNWAWYMYADIGAGDSDFTGTLRAGLDYSFNETWELELGYKGLWVDYEEGRMGTPGSFAYDTVTHGPLVGLKIHF